MTRLDRPPRKSRRSAADRNSATPLGSARDRRDSGTRQTRQCGASKSLTVRTQRQQRNGHFAVESDLTAGCAADLPDIAVQFHQRLRSGCGMQAVHVLSDQRKPLVTSLKFCQGVMRGVRVFRRKKPAAPVVPFPYRPWVSGKRLRRGKILGPEIPPQAVVPTEGRDPAVGRKPAPVSTTTARARCNRSLTSCNAVNFISGIDDSLTTRRKESTRCQ